MKDFCASLSIFAILSNNALAVPMPSPASFVEKIQLVNIKKNDEKQSKRNICCNLLDMLRSSAKFNIKV